MIAHTGRIWQAASDEPNRPVLNGVYFNAENGTLTATDSYVMAHVPCEVEPGDESGLVPADAIKEANGKSLKIANGKATLSMPDGERTWNLIEGTFVKADEILANAEASDSPIGLNPDLLKKLAAALGIPKGAAATLHPLYPLKPMLIGSPFPDVRGVIMPVRLSSGAGKNGNGNGAHAKIDLADDERVVAAVKAAAAALAARRGKRRAAEAFRKALAS